MKLLIDIGNTATKFGALDSDFLFLGRCFNSEISEDKLEALLELTIPEEDRDGEKVFAIDCSCAVYLALDVTAEQRFYANQSWWALDNENVLKETITFIKEKSPKWLIVAKDEESLTNYKDSLLSYELVSEEASRFYIYRLKAN